MNRRALLVVLALVAFVAAGVSASPTRGYNPQQNRSIFLDASQTITGVFAPARIPPLGSIIGQITNGQLPDIIDATTDVRVGGDSVALLSRNDQVFTGNKNSFRQIYAEDTVVVMAPLGFGTFVPSSDIYPTTTCIVDHGRDCPDQSIVFHTQVSSQEVAFRFDSTGLEFSVAGASAATANDIIFRTEETNSQFTPTIRAIISQAGGVTIGAVSLAPSAGSLYVSNLLQAVGFATFRQDIGVHSGSTGSFIDVVTAADVDVGRDAPVSHVVLHQNTSSQEVLIRNGGDGARIAVARHATATNNDIQLQTEESNSGSTPTTRVWINENGGTTFGSTDAAAGAGDVNVTARLMTSGEVSLSAGLRSYVATGTPPMVVASGTKVTNLHADNLDDGDYVSQIIAGTNVTITPTSGTGPVTINASGGSSGPTFAGWNQWTGTNIWATPSWFDSTLGVTGAVALSSTLAVDDTTSVGTDGAQAALVVYSKLGVSSAVPNSDITSNFLPTTPTALLDLGRLRPASAMAFHSNASSLEVALTVTGTASTWAVAGHSTGTNNDFQILTEESNAAFSPSTRFIVSSTGYTHVGSTEKTSALQPTAAPLLTINGTFPALAMFDTDGAQEVTYTAAGTGCFIQIAGHATATNNDFTVQTEESNSATTPTTRFIINQNGGTTVGATDLASTTRTLYANGTTEVAGALVTTPQTTVNLTADNQVVSTSSSYLKLTSDSAVAIDRTFTLQTTSVLTGAHLVLHWTDTDAGELADSGTVDLSAPWLPTNADTLTLIYSGTQWIETARSAN